MDGKIINNVLINSMTVEKMTQIIRKKYSEVAETLSKIEVEYEANKENEQTRNLYYYTAGKEMLLLDLCGKLGIEL